MEEIELNAVSSSPITSYKFPSRVAVECDRIGQLVRPADHSSSAPETQPVIPELIALFSIMGDPSSVF
jgi:hypothetical protein